MSQSKMENSGVLVILSLLAIGIWMLIWLPDRYTEDLRKKLEPNFSEFSSITTEKFPVKALRELEIGKLGYRTNQTVKKYEENIQFWPLNCKAEMWMRNPGTVYRKDELKVLCSWLKTDSW